MSLDEAGQLFLAYLSDERRCSPRTVTSYREELALFRAWCRGRGADVVTGITRDHVVGYLGPEGHVGSPIAPATRNRKLTVLRSFFRYLVEKDLAKKNPARDVRFSRLPRNEKQSLTRADVDHVLAAVEDTASWRKARDRCLIAMLFNTGLRLNELLSLKVSQIDVEKGLIREVRRKGGGEQPLPLNDGALLTVKAWLRERASVAGDTSALFVARGGTPLSRRAVQTRIKEVGAAAGFSFLHPHVLRHSFATELLATGANLEEVRRLMGHTSIVTTSRYSHPDQDALRRAVARLGARNSWK